MALRGCEDSCNIIPFYALLGMAWHSISHRGAFIEGHDTSRRCLCRCLQFRHDIWLVQKHGENGDDRKAPFLPRPAPLLPHPFLARGFDWPGLVCRLLEFPAESLAYLVEPLPHHRVTAQAVAANRFRLGISYTYHPQYSGGFTSSFPPSPCQSALICSRRDSPCSNLDRPASSSALLFCSLNRSHLNPDPWNSTRHLMLLPLLLLLLVFLQFLLPHF